MKISDMKIFIWLSFIAGLSSLLASAIVMIFPHDNVVSGALALKAIAWFLAAIVADRLSKR